MTEHQIELKEMIEKVFYDVFGETLIVDFVENVKKREKEILSLIKEDIKETYEANHFTGKFIPPTPDSPTYKVIIQKDRKDYLYIQSTFHEFEHAKLHYNLFVNHFKKDFELLKQSTINITFQIFSEFAACRSGISNYLKFVSFEDISKFDVAKNLIQYQIEIYKDSLNTPSGYEFLMNSAKLYGTIVGAFDVLQDIALNDFYDVFEMYDELSELFDLMLNYTDENFWYERFDSVVKKIITV